MICDVIDIFLYIYFVFCHCCSEEIKDIQFSEIPKVVVLDGVTTNTCDIDFTVELYIILYALRKLCCHNIETC